MHHLGHQPLPVGAIALQLAAAAGTEAAAAAAAADAEEAPVVRAEAVAGRAETSAALPDGVVVEVAGEDDADAAGEDTLEPVEAGAGDRPPEAATVVDDREEAEPESESDKAYSSGEDSDEAGNGEKRRRRRRRRSGWGIRAVASTALVLLALCWLPPYLAQRAENSALAAASDGRVAAGLTQARRAATLDPLAVTPLLTQATLLQQLGQNRAALAKLQEAARLQPQNFEVWYALGQLQQSALGQTRQARASFTRALALNPLDSASRYGLDSLAR